MCTGTVTELKSEREWYETYEITKYKYIQHGKAAHQYNDGDLELEREMM